MTHKCSFICVCAVISPPPLSSTSSSPSSDQDGSSRHLPPPPSSSFVWTGLWWDEAGASEVRRHCGEYRAVPCSLHPPFSFSGSFLAAWRSCWWVQPQPQPQPACPIVERSTRHRHLTTISRSWYCTWQVRNAVKLGVTESGGVGGMSEITIEVYLRTEGTLSLVEHWYCGCSRSLAKVRLLVIVWSVLVVYFCVDVVLRPLQPRLTHLRPKKCLANFSSSWLLSALAEGAGALPSVVLPLARAPTLLGAQNAASKPRLFLQGVPGHPKEAACWSGSGDQFG
jgi:hypothetical protein